MLVAPQSLRARKHCISSCVSHLYFVNYVCRIDIDLTLSSRVAISACAANIFLLAECRKLVGNLFVDCHLVVNVYAVEDHSYGRWTSIVHNTCARGGHHCHHCHYCHCSRRRRSAELCRSFTVNALHAAHCMAAISSLQSRESFSSSISFNCRVSSP
jgi:hypothetical protein